MAKRKSPLTLGELAGCVAAIAPERWAEEWDNVGLQVGDSAAPVARAMTCLEVTPPVIAEAKRRKVDALIAHHPLLFHPAKQILGSDPVGRLLTELVRAGIGLIVAHTNLDCATWGTNEVLAERCGLRPTGSFIGRPEHEPTKRAPLKLVVFVPEGHEHAIIDAIAAAGGGQIGAYTHCTFRTPGTGTFLGAEGSKPFIGQAGRLEEARELRVEALVPRERRARVLESVLKSHPYEEPAYEFYVLDSTTESSGVSLGPSSIGSPGESGQNSAGLGCMARAQPTVSFRSFLARVKKGLGLTRLRVSGPTPRRVRNVAVCTGSGGSFLAKAAATPGVDVYLTGEANYHQGVEAHLRTMAMVEVGHFESEVIVAEPLAERLASDERIRGSSTRIFPARKDLQPFRYA